MTKRDVVKMALENKTPPYVPWAFWFTHEAYEKLETHFGQGTTYPYIDNHICQFGANFGNPADLENDRWRDGFGVIWDRSKDKDIGVVEGQVLPEPSLSNFQLPDISGEKTFGHIPDILRDNDNFCIFAIGFSLYERAWTLRGMETLMMDFYDHPKFVKELFRSLADFNISLVKRAVQFDIDGVYFGDDWGQQIGLQMGPALWHEFIYPELKRMYAAVKEAGKYVFIHSCGDVDELFDDLVDIGLDCFNPFQPEVMDVATLSKQYKGRLSFHGGLSTQKTLPYGTVEDVVQATKQLIELGSDGNFIIAPAHAVEGDVPLENMLAMIETVKQQPGYVHK